MNILKLVPAVAAALLSALSTKRSKKERKKHSPGAFGTCFEGPKRNSFGRQFSDLHKRATADR